MPDRAPAGSARGVRRPIPTGAWVVFAVALVVRLAVLLQVQSSVFARVLVGDGRQYAIWAKGIAAGDWVGQGVFYQAPLYPYFLGLLSVLAGPSPLAARLVQCLIGAGACVALYLAGRRFFDERTGRIAGILWALYAPAVFFDILIQKTVLDAALMCVLLWTLAAIERRPRRAALYILGIVLAAASLTRENAVVLAPVLALWVALHFRDRGRTRWLWIAFFLIGLATPLLPVAIRNRVAGGEFALTTAQAGPNFYLGNNATTDGRYVPLRPGRADARYERIDATELAEATVGRRLSPAEVSSFWFRQATDFIRREPGAWLRLMARKSGLFWNAGEVADTESIEACRDASWVLRGLSLVVHFGVIAPLAALGLVLTWRDRRRLWVLYGVLLAMSAGTILFFIMARYRHPMAPALVLFAAAGVAGLFSPEAARDWRTRRFGIALAALLLASLATNLPFPYHAEQRALGYYSVGDALLDEGRAAEAIPCLQEALRSMPDFRPALSRLGSAYSDEGQTRFAAGDLEGALVAYRKAAEMRPDSASAQTNLGATLVGLGRDEEALPSLQRAVSLRPNLGLARFNLGLALLRLGRTSEAGPHLDAAAVLEPGNAGVFLIRGMLREREGRTQEAAADYARALELDPRLAEARSRLAALAPLRLAAPR